MKKTIILILFIYIHTNTFSQRESYFSVSTKYLTPIYDLDDNITEEIKGTPSIFNTFQGGLKILNWLRLGGSISLTDQSQDLLNAALMIGIKNINFYYETGNFEGIVSNTIPKIDPDDGGLPINIGNFSNSFNSFAILKNMGNSNDSFGSPAKYGIGFTSLTLPTLAEVKLNDSYDAISYLDPNTRINYYGFVFKADSFYLALQGNSWYNKGFGLDFGSSAILGISTATPSSFGRNELEQILQNGVNNPSYSFTNENINPNGFISTEGKTSYGFGISGDFRLGISYINNQNSNKIAFGASAGYILRAWTLFSIINNGKPEDNEYFQSTSGTIILQHGPYVNVQVNW